MFRISQDYAFIHIVSKCWSEDGGSSLSLCHMTTSFHRSSASPHLTTTTTASPLYRIALRQLNRDHLSYDSMEPLLLRYSFDASLVAIALNGGGALLAFCCTRTGSHCFAAHPPRPASSTLHSTIISMTFTCDDLYVLAVTEDSHLVVISRCGQPMLIDDVTTGTPRYRVPLDPILKYVAPRHPPLGTIMFISLLLQYYYNYYIYYFIRMKTMI